MSLLKSPTVILGAFICFKVYQVCFSFINGEGHAYLPWLRLGSVVLLIVASYFAINKNRIALWVMGILLISNLFAVIGGMLFVPLQQYGLKLFAALLGSYFVCGGVMLIKQARELSRVEA